MFPKRRCRPISGFGDGTADHASQTLISVQKPEKTAMNANDDLRRRMRRDAAAVFDAGLAAVSAEAAVKAHFQRHEDILAAGGRRFNLNAFDRIRVIGAGKATAAMAAAVEEVLGDGVAGGSITVKYGHGEALKRVETVEAGHPLPDAKGRDGARRILDIAEQAGPGDLIICLLSGGGSALMPLPAAGLTLADKQRTMDVLLACGAAIHEINTIRKHTSAIKGGQLARAAAPATLVTLVLSDVVGDELDVIASGPTVPDTSTFAQALDIVRRYEIASKLPAAVMDHLRSGAAGQMPETPKPGLPAFAAAFTTVIGSNIQALKSARETAVRLGYHSLVLSSMIEGETRDAARFHMAVAAEIAKSGLPLPPPACLISGGETTVTLTGRGVGGRNQEFALAAALHLKGRTPTLILSAGTDGTDGPTDAAGAFADHTTIDRARAIGLDPARHLVDNNAYPFFKQLDDLLITGPTGTNVMDMRIVLVE